MLPEMRSTELSMKRQQPIHRRKSIQALNAQPLGGRLHQAAAADTASIQATDANARVDQIRIAATSTQRCH